MRDDITTEAERPSEQHVETPEDAVAPVPADDATLSISTSEDDEDVDSEDSLTFSNGVIEKIVAIAVRDVPGVLGMKGGFINRVQEMVGGASPTKGVSVEVMPDNSVRVNISVMIEYGTYAPQVFEDVKKAVVKQVAGMTGLEVGGVNLRIEDVLTPEEFERVRRDSREGADTEEEARTEPAAPVMTAEA